MSTKILKRKKTFNTLMEWEMSYLPSKTDDYNLKDFETKPELIASVLAIEAINKIKSKILGEK